MTPLGVLLLYSGVVDIIQQEGGLVLILNHPVGTRINKIQDSINNKLYYICYVKTYDKTKMLKGGDSNTLISFFK